MEFRALSNRKPINLIEYVKEYITKNPQTEILIGCDSQNTWKSTTYATVVALYLPRAGAHVLYCKEVVPVEKVRQLRLMNEVWKSVEIAEELRLAGIPRAKYIDVDLNPDKRFKSNEVFRSAVGLVEGMGYTVRYKSLGALVTHAADSLVK
jgi:predicted RNase H-related nuclease YkuK (DUF458 family)